MNGKPLSDKKDLGALQPVEESLTVSEVNPKEKMPAVASKMPDSEPELAGQSGDPAPRVRSEVNDGQEVDALPGNGPAADIKPVKISATKAAAPPAEDVEYFFPDEAQDPAGGGEDTAAEAEDTLVVETEASEAKPSAILSPADIKTLIRVKSEQLQADLRQQFPSLDEAKELIQAEGMRLRAELQSMIRLELVRREQAQAGESLTTTQELAGQLQAIKIENMRLGLEVLRDDVGQVLQNPDRPLRERWEDVDYAHGLLTRMEQDIAGQETTAARRVANTAHILAELEGEGAVADLRRDLEQQRQAVAAVEDRQAATPQLTAGVRWALGLALVALLLAGGLGWYLLQQQSQSNIELQLRLAAVAQASGEREQALELLDQVVESGVSDPEALFEIGQTYLALKAFDQAILALERGVAREPNNEQARLALAGAYAGGKRGPEAIVQYQRLIELNPVNWRYYYQLGRQYLALPNYEEALVQFQRVTEIVPNNYDGFYWQGMTYRRMGQFEQAIAQFEKSLARNPGYYWTYLNLGQIYLEQGVPEQAVLQFETAISIHPDNRQGYYWLGEAQRNAGNIASAVTAYQQALDLAPDTAGAHLGLGLAFLARDDCAGASAQFIEVLRLQPDNEEALAGLETCRVGSNP